MPDGFDRLLPSAVLRHSLHFLPAEKVHILMGPLLVQKWASRSNFVALRQLGEWIAWSVFDRWVARQLPRLQPHVVVGYEMCCAETFKVAKSLGITRVLDAAAFHYATQDEILGDENAGSRTWAGEHLRRSKHAEVELADVVICVSELSRRSYIEAGVEDIRTAVNQVGCDTAQFKAPYDLRRVGQPKFVFVGIPAYHKGFDVLMSSFAQLLDQYPDAELHVVGDAAMANSMGTDGHVHIHGKLTHDQLSKLLAKMDCLVLPSRLESFGMVVVEALASGVPVIVSDHAGSSEVVSEDKNGWLVAAGDSSILLERLVTCCRDIERVRSMRDGCIKSAAGYDWVHYARRTLDIFEPLINGH